MVMSPMLSWNFASMALKSKEKSKEGGIQLHYSASAAHSSR